jgi:uncharacterized protein (UPF0335 family)
MNTEQKVILLAKLLQVKELQTHLVKEEQKIKEEISRIENLEEERKQLREPNDITGDLWK